MTSSRSPRRAQRRFLLHMFGGAVTQYDTKNSHFCRGEESKSYLEAKKKKEEKEAAAKSATDSNTDSAFSAIPYEAYTLLYPML